MTSLSGLGIGLSVVFGCLLLALVAELYYLLWWKKRVTNREIEEEEDDDYISSNHAKEIFQFNCFKKPNSLHTSSNRNSNSHENLREPDVNVNGSSEPDLEQGSRKDLLLKLNGEENVEISELMRLHNLAGPPRFLFTIKEEEKEDLESEDGKSKSSRKGSRTRSLSDIILAVDTPFLSPMPSPSVKPSPLSNLEAYKHHGFNPLFESSTEAEMNRLKSSPPPKFKFLRDAEEKLLRRLMEEAEKRAAKNGGTGASAAQDCGAKASTNSTMTAEEREGSFIRLIVGKNKENHQNPPSSSKVLPLVSSPACSTQLDKMGQLDLC
ncbi:unnamed protein product [Malus baccata var. baccata]